MSKTEFTTTSVMYCFSPFLSSYERLESFPSTAISEPFFYVTLYNLCRFSPCYQAMPRGFTLSFPIPVTVNFAALYIISNNPESIKSVHLVTIGGITSVIRSNVSSAENGNAFFRLLRNFTWQKMYAQHHVCR